MSWITEPVLLEGNQVKLVPLDRAHFDDFISIASDKCIWAYYALDGSDAAKLAVSLENALIERALGIQYPFVVMLRTGHRIIGSTRFLELQQAHQKLEIGWTWFYPDYWGTGINPECKWLLLSYCFEELRTRRVQLKTDERNQRSRKAIEKIGGQFEGIIRNDMVRDDGTSRHSAYYSITDDDWRNGTKKRWAS